MWHHSRVPCNLPDRGQDEGCGHTQGIRLDQLHHVRWRIELCCSYTQTKGGKSCCGKLPMIESDISFSERDLKPAPGLIEGLLEHVCLCPNFDPDGLVQAGSAVEVDDEWSHPLFFEMEGHNSRPLRPNLLGVKGYEQKWSAWRGGKVR